MPSDLLRQPRYVIDTSALIDLATWYPPDVAPGAWTKIEQLIASGDLVSSSEVLEELKAQDDDLLAWAKQHSELFLPPVSEVQHVVKAILAESPTLIDHKKRKSSADPFVIAIAEIHGCAVVAQEIAAQPGQRHKIPDVCELRGVEHRNLVQLLSAEGVRLVLEQDPD